MAQEKNETFKVVNLNEEEMKEVKKLSDKHVAVKKLLLIYEALNDITVKDNIKTCLNYLKFLQESMTAAMEFIKDENNIQQLNNSDEIPDNMTLKVAILTDKQNGLPERLRDIPKFQMETTRDIYEFFKIAKFQGMDEESIRKEQEGVDTLNIYDMKVKK
jgi:hypothetical protein